MLNQTEARADKKYIPQGLAKDSQAEFRQEIIHKEPQKSSLKEK